MVNRNGLGLAPDGSAFISWKQFIVIVTLAGGIIASVFAIGYGWSLKADVAKVEASERKLCAQIESGDNKVRKEVEKEDKALKELIVANQKTLEAQNKEILELIKKR